MSSKSDVSHTGITLNLEGMVSLQLSAKSVGLFEAFYNSLKPVQLIYYNVEVAPPGKLYPLIIMVFLGFSVVDGEGMAMEWRVMRAFCVVFRAFYAFFRAIVPFLTPFYLFSLPFLSLYDFFP